MNADKSHPKKSGQILVLMALLSTTLVILFGMVVGVGHLIQAKMNLQNATDLAAMSGASLQARFMNHVALVNYRLRQNYKFQLYDFYVTASRFNRGLRQSVQTGLGNPLARINFNETSFGICQQSFGFDPNFGSQELGRSSGTRTAFDTDFCRNVQGSGGVGLTIPPIIPSPVPNLNPILIAANLAVFNLSNQLRALCASNSTANQQYFDIMSKALDLRQRHQVQQMVKIISQFDQFFGTGDLLDGNRPGDSTMLRTLQDNLISANKTGNIEARWLVPSQVRAFRVGAGSQLESRIFDRGAPGGGFADYFERSRVQLSFPYVSFGANCSVRVLKASSPFPTIISLARARLGSGPVLIPIATALQVTVTPNLLFWPRGLTPTLVAVGGSKAFGSRIGPPSELTEIEVTGSGNPGESIIADVQGNMSFYPGDYTTTFGVGPMPGIGHKVILSYLFNSLFRAGGGPGSGDRTQRPSTTGFGSPGDCKSPGGGPLPFVCLALAPTLYEGLFYNAFEFPASQDPLIRAGFPSDFSQLIQVADAGKYLLPDRQLLGLTPQQAEGWHATKFIGSNPIFRTPTGNPMFFADTVSVQSSWSPDFAYNLGDLDPGAGQARGGNPVGETNPKGRMGYSIKLVSLRELCDLMEQGQKVQPTGLLREYCSTGGVRTAFH